MWRITAAFVPLPLSIRTRFAFLLILSGAGLPGCCPDALYELVTPAPQVRLPADETPHCFGGGEWWYYTGELHTADDHGYGVEAVVFHVPALPILILADVWVAHYSVLDEATGAFVYDQVRVLQPPPRDASTENGFDLHTPLIDMTGGDGDDHIHATMGDGRFALDLALRDERGPVLHGGDGYVPYGPRGNSFYYSRPRMHATGTLDIDGQPQPVTGDFWFDRQWGRDISTPWLRWDWFSVRLDDGSDVMLYAFRDQPTAVALGTYLPPTGAALTLGTGEFTITPTATWTSPHTGFTYPAGWTVAIPAAELSVTVTPVANDQELDALSTTLNVYWEGLCTVTGTHAGHPVSGTAYVELTNYLW